MEKLLAQLKITHAQMENASAALLKQGYIDEANKLTWAAKTLEGWMEEIKEGRDGIKPDRKIA